MRAPRPIAVAAESQVWFDERNDAPTGQIFCALGRVLLER